VTAIAFPAASKGTAWLGTADQGVAFFAGEKITQVFNSQAAGLTSNRIQALLAASDGSLWIGTDQGLDHYLANGQWAHYTVGNPFDQGLEGITSVAEAAHGLIWVSTAGEGNVVHQWSAGQWQRLAGGQPGVKLPGSPIQSLTVTPDGSVWFGSASSGAARFDGQTWTTFNIQDGLINPNIHDTYVDTQGSVWFATEGGVSRYRP
jgi:ligand-binding sensor domain-containing protein